MVIEWRLSHLLTDLGAAAMLYSSVAAKAKILNFSHPGSMHGFSLIMAISRSLRPGRAIDALEKALQGTHAVLPGLTPKVSVKSSHIECDECELKRFVQSILQKTEVHNLMFDLVYGHLEASDVSLGSAADA